MTKQEKQLVLDALSTAIVQWRIYSSGDNPDFTDSENKQVSERFRRKAESAGELYLKLGGTLWVE